MSIVIRCRDHAITVVAYSVSVREIIQLPHTLPQVLIYTRSSSRATCSYMYVLQLKLKVAIHTYMYV